MSADLIKGSIPEVVFGVLGIVAVTLLAALGTIEGAAAVTLIAAITGGGVGHANGYRQGTQNGNGV